MHLIDHSIILVISTITQSMVLIQGPSKNYADIVRMNFHSVKWTSNTMLFDFVDESLYQC